MVTFEVVHLLMTWSTHQVTLMESSSYVSSCVTHLLLDSMTCQGWTSSLTYRSKLLVTQVQLAQALQQELELVVAASQQQSAQDQYSWLVFTVQASLRTWEV